MSCVFPIPRPYALAADCFCYTFTYKRCRKHLSQPTVEEEKEHFHLIHSLLFTPFMSYRKPNLLLVSVHLSFLKKLIHFRSLLSQLVSQYYINNLCSFGIDKQISSHRHHSRGHRLVPASIFHRRIFRNVQFIEFIVMLLRFQVHTKKRVKNHTTSLHSNFLSPLTTRTIMNHYAKSTMRKRTCVRIKTKRGVSI